MYFMWGFVQSIFGDGKMKLGVTVLISLIFYCFLACVSLWHLIPLVCENRFREAGIFSRTPSTDDFNLVGGLVGESGSSQIQTRSESVFLSVVS